MDLTVWLLSVVDLFDKALDAVLSLPVLAFFLYALLFLTVLRVMAWLVRGARRRM